VNLKLSKSQLRLDRPRLLHGRLVGKSLIFQ
jgi:hypothetical protein